MCFEILSKAPPRRLTKKELCEFCEEYFDNKNYDIFYRALIKITEEIEDERQD